MKEYKAYMDRVSVSDELHEKLLGLNTAKGRPAWQKYGAAAACLLLLAGAGLYGAGYRWRQLENDFVPASVEEVEPAPSIDLAVEDPNDAEPGMKTIPGFEVPETVAGVDVVTYYVLPWIDYGPIEREISVGVSLDYAAPEGSTSRELTREDVLALTGGEDVLETLLDWGGFTYSGTVVFHPDGKVWQLSFAGTRDDCFFELELAPDALPLTCILTEPRTVTEIWGVEVTGRYCGIHGEGPNREVWMPESRGVEFVANGVGCRLRLYGLEGEGEQVETMVSRFVRQAILEGLDLSAVTPSGAVLTGNGSGFSVGEPNWNDSGTAPSVPPQEGLSPE